MDQVERSTHRRNDEPQLQVQTGDRRVIRAAVETLCEQRQISEMSAYELLVQTAADEGSRVRDVALRVTAQSRNDLQ